MESLQKQYPLDYQFTPNDISYLLGRLLLASAETERVIKESSQETDRRFRETERFINEKFAETARVVEETNKSFGRLGNSWGDFLEGLAKPGLLEYFSKIGIEVHNVFSNVKEERMKVRIYEIDLLMFNEKYVIAVEVKSKLTKERVDEHLTRLKKIIEYPPLIFNIKGKMLIGAIAAVSSEPEVDEYAIRNGLYLMVQKSNLIEIVNPPDFRPAEWKIE